MTPQKHAGRKRREWILIPLVAAALGALVPQVLMFLLDAGHAGFAALLIAVVLFTALAILMRRRW